MWRRRFRLRTSLMKLCPTMTIFVMWLADVQAAAMTNMKHMPCVPLDGEQDAVCVRPFPIQKLTHFKREVVSLGS